MIGGRMNSSWGNLSTIGLAIVLVLGTITIHVPFPARLSVDRCDNPESCGACECAPNGSLAGQPSPVEPEATPHFTHSEREAPADEPCCPDDCRLCALPCCGGVTLAIAPSAASPNFPAATLITPVPTTIPHAIDTTDIFHPPRI